jgi:glucose/arabinose dehydrogenase
MNRCLSFALIASLWMASLGSAQTLELKKGDHICLVGNTLAERMQHVGWLETLIQSRFPEHELVFRNLGFSGDEIKQRLRSMDFGTPDQWLSASAPVPQPKKLRENPTVRENRFEFTNTKADVIFAFFGYNESFAGEAGLEPFKKDLDGWVKHTLGQKYNGESAPRLVLFSPVAFENLKDKNLPDGSEHNPRLKLYSTAMAEVAKANGAIYVDLFAPTLAAYAGAKSPLTINGVHLNEAGDFAVATIADRVLFGARPGKDAAPEALEKLRAAVNDKNFYWFNRYRTTDGYSTFGDRAFLKFTGGQSNYEVLQRELETLDLMTANRDRVVWAAAQGKEAKAKDENLPEFIPVVTNKPGSLEGGKHAFLNGGEASIAKMTLGKGLKINLFASEEDFPELINPVQMSFDTKGRLWVATWPTYPHWKPGEEMNDRLLILEDTNGDGKADKCKTFVDHLHAPTGFEFWGGGVLVAQQPDLVFLKDTDGDDKADVRNRVLHGLDSADTHHASNSFTLDPGGAMYFQEGTFHQTQVESAWKPSTRCSNAGVFRYEPRAQKFDVYVSFGFANPHGHAFNHWGQDIVVDGTGANPYHAVLFSGHLDYPQKHARPPQVYQQRTRPCPGIEFLSSSHFPEEFRGNLLVGNVIGFQGILRYKIEDQDSSFKGTELEPIVYSSDPNFRPADLETAPDGSIYFTDWQNPIIGHMQHNLRDPSRDRVHGRVYRIVHEGRDLVKPQAIAGEPVEKLLDLLKEPDDRVRYRVRLELSGRKTEDVIPATKKWLASLDKNDSEFEHHQLEGLWVHQHHNVVDEELLNKVLASKEFRARAAGTRVLCYWRDRVKDPLATLQKLVNDDAGRVRLEAIRALSFYHGEQAKKAIDVVTEALIHPDDPYIKYTFGETMKALEKQKNSK